MKFRYFLFLTIVILHRVSYGQMMSGEDKSRYQVALEKYQENNYAICIEICSQIAERCRESSVFKLRALAYNEVGELERSELDFTEAMQTSSKRDPGLYFERGILRLKMKKFEKAELDFIDAQRSLKDQISPGLELFPVLEELGHAQHYNGNFKSAITNYVKAIDNGSSRAYIDLLSAYLQTNNMIDLNYVSDTLIRSDNYVLKSDSLVLDYLIILNHISISARNEADLMKISSLIRSYSSCNKIGFCGLYYDLLYAQYKLFELNRLDSMAYCTLKKYNLGNENNPTVKAKIIELKHKLGFDAEPPVITLINPVPNSFGSASVTGKIDKILIYGRVVDASGQPELFLNNKPVFNIEYDGIFTTKVSLNVGRNTLTFTATDKEDNKATKTYYIDFINEQPAYANSTGNTSVSDIDIPEINENTRNIAILIAEKDYEDPNLTDLASPILDAAELKNILQSKYTFDEKNIITLFNIKRNVIIDTLDKICRDLTVNENLLVFYAGHGDVKEKDNTVIGGYIIPIDAIKGNRATYISSEDLFEPVSSSEGHHILFIVDACFGGALMRSSYDNAPQHIKNLNFLKSRNIITSGNIEEVPDQGKFIQNVLQYLRSNQKKYTSALELFTFIQTNTDSSNTPQFGQIKNSGDTGGKFIFVQRD